MRLLWMLAIQASGLFLLLVICVTPEVSLLLSLATGVAAAVVIAGASVLADGNFSKHD